MADNYTVDTIKELDKIEFPKFVADLLNGTFEAILKANIEQTEAYVELLQEASKTLTAYINDTKLETLDEDILEYLSALPSFPKSDGSPILDATPLAEGEKPSPLKLEPSEQVEPKDLNDLNTVFTDPSVVSNVLKTGVNPTGKALETAVPLLKDALGLVKDLAGDKAEYKDVFPLASHPDFYDPSKLTEILGEQTAPPPPLDIQSASLGKLYDAVSELIAANKYSLLQEIMKLGKTTTIVESGVVQASVVFTAYERLSASNADYDRHETRVKERNKERRTRRGGIFGILAGRSFSKNRRKTRELKISTKSATSQVNQGSSATVTGMVRLNLRTDRIDPNMA